MTEHHSFSAASCGPSATVSSGRVASLARPVIHHYSASQTEMCDELPMSKVRSMGQVKQKWTRHAALLHSAPLVQLLTARLGIVLGLWNDIK